MSAVLAIVCWSAVVVAVAHALLRDVLDDALDLLDESRGRKPILSMQAQIEEIKALPEREPRR